MAVNMTAQTWLDFLHVHVDLALFLGLIREPVKVPSSIFDSTGTEDFGQLQFFIICML